MADGDVLECLWLAAWGGYGDSIGTRQQGAAEAAGGRIGGARFDVVVDVTGGDLDLGE